MWKDESIRKGVIASVIASLVVIIFITPFLNLIWGALTNGGLWIQKVYVNSIFESAALGDRNWLDVVFYLYFFSALVGVMVISTLKISRERSKLSRKIDGLDDKDNLDVKQKTEKEIKEEIAKVKEMFRKGKWKVFKLYGLILLVLVSSASSYFRAFADLQLNTTFKQRINIVAPHINEQEEEELYSQWALMKSRQDYEIINKKFDEIATKVNIKLPKPLMK